MLHFDDGTFLRIQMKNREKLKFVAHLVKISVVNIHTLKFKTETMRQNHTKIKILRYIIGLSRGDSGFFWIWKVYLML